jgi:hypothetical protein
MCVAVEGCLSICLPACPSVRVAESAESLSGCDVSGAKSGVVIRGVVGRLLQRRAGIVKRACGRAGKDSGGCEALVGKEAWAGGRATGYHGAGVDLVQQKRLSLCGVAAREQLVWRLDGGGQGLWERERETGGKCKVLGEALANHESRPVAVSAPMDPWPVHTPAPSAPVPAHPAHVHVEHHDINSQKIGHDDPALRATMPSTLVACI